MAKERALGLGLGRLEGVLEQKRERFVSQTIGAHELTQEVDKVELGLGPGRDPPAAHDVGHELAEIVLRLGNEGEGRLRDGFGT
jgi:hypothetical protein